MGNKTVSDLRAALFDTLAKLQDNKNPMDIDRAKAVSEVAQTIINTAKVEIDFMRATGQQNAGSGFMQIEAGQPTSTGVVTRQIGVDGLASTVHRMRG
jgi:hypothetical protein